MKRLHLGLAHSGTSMEHHGLLTWRTNCAEAMKGYGVKWKCSEVKWFRQPWINGKIDESELGARGAQKVKNKIVFTLELCIFV